MYSSTKARLKSVGKPFRALLASDVLMIMSLMVGHVAVPWWIAHEGGAAHLAIYGAMMAMVAFVSMPLLSPLGDRYPKRSLITVGLLMFVGEGLFMAALASLGFYHLGLLIALEAITVVAMSLILPASLSIAADLVEPHRLADAISLQKSAQAAGRLMGPALGGMMLAVSGTAGALWLHTGLVMLASMLAWRIPFIPKHPGKGGADRWWRDIRAGLSATWDVPIERGRIAINFLVMVFYAPGVGMLVPLKVQSLGLSGAWLGACEAALSLGMLGGFLGGSSWLAESLGRYRVVILAIMVEGLALALAGYTRQPLVLVFAFAMIGLGLSVVQLVGQTHRMLAIPEDFRSRMTSVGIMVAQIAGTLGPGIAGVTLLHFPIGPVYIVFGLAVFASAFGYFVIPRYREFLSLDHTAVIGWYGKQYPKAFGRGEVK
ncbi:MFS transporter [Chitinimonas arctica]|uniref:MFS transporter n=1 Tax=Chitinimonas arctica TaxID=2594795 RepID=A0A516SKT0_9NEIS|nr:MFS transporter [Chitinimonas arctica]QDQ28765.1 MFS transporter [Chitinimonas arctica]